MTDPLVLQVRDALQQLLGDNNKHYSKTIYLNLIYNNDQLVLNFLTANKKLVEPTVKHIIRMLVKCTLLFLNSLNFIPIGMED